MRTISGFTFQPINAQSVQVNSCSPAPAAAAAGGPTWDGGSEGLSPGGLSSVLVLGRWQVQPCPGTSPRAPLGA